MEEGNVNEIGTEVQTTVIKKEHQDLRQEFLSRVSHLIQQPGEISSYQVQSKNYGETEAIELDVNGFQVTISVFKTS